MRDTGQKDPEYAVASQVVVATYCWGYPGEIALRGAGVALDVVPAGTRSRESRVTAFLREFLFTRPLPDAHVNAMLHRPLAQREIPLVVETWPKPVNATTLQDVATFCSCPVYEKPHCQSVVWRNLCRAPSGLARDEEGKSLCHSVLGTSGCLSER